MLELIGMQKKELYSLISNPLKEQVLASLAAFPLGPRYAPVIYEIVRPKQYEQQYAHTGETRALDIEDVNDRMYRIPMEAPLSSRSYQELDFILYSWRRDHPDAQQPAMMSFEMEHKNSLVNELHLQIFGRKAPTRIKK